MLGRYEEAVAVYEGVISSNPGWWEAHANLGICHDRNGERDKAEAAFRRGLKECPGSPELRDELAAHFLAERRNLEEALKLSEEAVALGRDEVRHLYTLGEARAALQDDAGAEEAYRAVLTLDPEDPEAHLELGLLYERRGRIPEAEEQFMEALRRDPNNPRALHSYAALYYAAGDPRTAEEMLTRAVAADPGYSPAFSALAGIRAGQGDREGALRLMEKAVEAGERDASYFESAPEFSALREDPAFRSLLKRMDPGGG
jgi:Flp pilus assembly protein TadD